MRTDATTRTGRRSRVVDQRGKEFALCRVEDLPEGASEELKEAVRRGNEHRWIVQVAAVAIGIVIGTGFLMLILWAFGLKFRASSMGGVIGGVVGGVVATQMRAGAAGKKAVSLCLKEEVCPGCGYDLKGLSGEERVCPECGGAWRMEQRGG